jgi:hypothetical protein
VQILAAPDFIDYIHALAAERKKLSQLRSTGIEKDEK